MNRVFVVGFLLLIGLFGLFIYLTDVSQPPSAQAIQQVAQPIYHYEPDPYEDRKRRVEETKRICLERGGVPIYGNVSYQWIERCDFPVVVSK